MSSSSSVVVTRRQVAKTPVRARFLPVVKRRRPSSSGVKRRHGHKKPAALASRPKAGNLRRKPNKKPPSRYQRLRGSGARVTKRVLAPQRLGHPWAPRNPLHLRVQVAPVSKSGLSPAAALCLRVVKGWLGVVRRGKGGEVRNGVPYTRLKASEVQQQLEAEQGVTVSTKTVQRALTELVVGGHLTRRQLYKHRYNRTYWYAPSEAEQQAEQHRPSVVAKQQPATGVTKGSPRPAPKGAPERSAVSLQALKAQLPYSTQKAASSQTAKQPQTGEAPCGQPEPQQEAVSKAWGKRRPTAQTPRTGAHRGRLEQAQQQLAEVVQRAVAYKGFGFTQQGSASKPVPLVTYKAESAQAAGFLR